MTLEVGGAGPVAPAEAGLAGAGAGAGARPGRGRGRLDIGLVNNMPDAALRATEAQFTRLLAAASGARDLRLHLFALPGVPRGPAARAHMRGRYGDLDALRASRLDALIVTGAEPLAPVLTAEPYWDDLARVVDWAEGNTASTVWSCLAAHAAVLHLDGVSRRRLPAKRSGLFECLRAADGGLFEGAPAGMRVPHSRWNDLAEGDLRHHGYRIASRSPEAGVDSFTKQWGSLFVFLQGHPEYDRDTLFREYRRDAQRFASGKRDDMPSPPAHYFDARTEAAAAAFAAGAIRGRGAVAWSDFPADWGLRPDLVAAWEASVKRLYANWLDAVAARR